MIKRIVVSVTILFSILLLLLPKTDDASKIKIASASMLMCTSDYRAAVAEQVSHNEDVDVEFKNKCSDLITDLAVDEGGMITIVSEKYHLSMVLSPVLESDRVRWSCQGRPAEAITALCKP